jgi:hypothetical protein
LRNKVAVKNKMKIEKKIVTLSIIATVLGIVTILPIAYTPLASAEPTTELQDFPVGFHIVNGVTVPGEAFTSSDDVIPFNIDGLPAYVAVPSTDGENNRLHLMPIEEFHEIYGTNATIPQVDLWTGQILG